MKLKQKIKILKLTRLFCAPFLLEKKLDCNDIFDLAENWLSKIISPSTRIKNKRVQSLIYFSSSLNTMKVYIFYKNPFFAYP